MPPSQLKRLKASLREQGIVGQTKSKKQKKKGLSTEQKIRRNVALESIRETFNPFEVKHLSRPAKREYTTIQSMSGKTEKGAVGRPGVSKSLGEERRKQSLLLEVQTRRKVGGIVDRRIGEDDPDMPEEEKALQRYTWEKQRKKKTKGSVFNLEGGDDGEDFLTHGGRTLDLEEDYDAASVESGSDSEDEAVSRKRAREDIEEQQDPASGQPEYKKSRAEIMEEVMKKSKLHKYERQQAKEEDDDLRIELDKDLSSVRAALTSFQTAIHRSKEADKQPAQPVAPTIHPDREAMMNGSEPNGVDKAYDQQLRKIAQDKRAKPTDRIRTEEEVSKEHADRLKELEDNRLKRMAGDIGQEEEDHFEKEKVAEPENIFAPEEVDDAAEFGLQGKTRHSRPEGIDDEDDFLLEEDFIAGASEAEEDDDGGDDASSDDGSESSEDELLVDREDAAMVEGTRGSGACPRTLDELRLTFDGVPYPDYHETIRTIRLRADPSLNAANKGRLADFSSSLVHYLAELPAKLPCPPSETLDVVIRHIHSMARKTPDPVCDAFRQHLRRMHAEKSMTSGDLVVLAAIGSIFPPSDHFHPIVTPATLLMARWLGMTTPQTPKDLATGAYVGALCLQYQSLAKRYIPELVRFTLLALSPSFPSTSQTPHISNLLTMAALWSSKSAFPDIIAPFLPALRQLSPQPKKPLARLTLLHSQSLLARRPLALHNHRPLAIRSAVPKFEDGFDPTKHYDPDAARAESTKLRKEFKKERKGAMRELRKDGNFLARQQLREKRERDQAYEEKYRKLVSEIQGEEGRESNAYERERQARRRSRRS
jgi:nucleolar protein 14